MISEGDGLVYSYSVFNDYKQIGEACESVHMVNTTDAAPDLYRAHRMWRCWGLNTGLEPSVNRNQATIPRPPRLAKSRCGPTL